MFNQLSDQEKILTSLQKLSPSELVLATANLKKQILLLNVDATELLANRRNYGALLGSAFANSNLDGLAGIRLNELLSSEQHLTNAINTLCLTEAILVRDTFKNALELIAELELTDALATQQKITTSETSTNTVDKNSTALQASTLQTKNQPASNVAPIHLVEVKQRLSQALQPNTKQHESIKSKLNSLLTTKGSIHIVKQA